MRNILFNRRSSKLGLLGSLVAVVAVSLVLALLPKATAVNTQAVTCDNAPTTPTLNYWPVTFEDEDTPKCHDFVAIDAAVYNPGSAPEFSQSEADWNNGLELQPGQRGVALMYIHNGAANNLPHEQTTAKNVKVTTTTDTSVGSTHKISVKYQGDNTNTVTESFTIKTPANAKLEVEANSGAVYNNHGELTDRTGLNLGNSTYNLGDLQACFEYSLFLSFRFKVVTENPPVENPDLSITKHVRSLDDNSSFAKSVTVDKNERVQYRVVVKNTGDTVLKNVTMKDSGTSGVEIDSNSVVITGYDYPSNVSKTLPGTLQLGNLAVNEEITIIYNGRATASQGTFVNTAIADSDNTGSKEDKATVIVNKPEEPTDREISISKLVKNNSDSTSYRDSVDAKIGERVNFKVTVTNTGNATVNNVKVTDRLPSELKFDDSVSGDGTANFNNSTFTVNFGSLSKGQSKTVEFAAKVIDGDDGDTICNTARATGDDVASKEDKACVDINIPSKPEKPGTPNIEQSKKAYNNSKNADATTVSADRGNTITFTLTTKNTGNATKHDYVITDDLSGVLPLADIVDLNGGKLNGNILTFPAMDIKAGETVTKTFKVSVKTTLAPSISYQIKNTYGNTVIINIPGKTVYEAPKTGSGATSAAVFAGLLTAGAVVVRRGKDIMNFIFA
jgi:uncharacterized repeat protein (TIGR01451 family)/fimbrial isopeptide formation D2 family protein